jgi:hypothetical protein
MVCAPTYWCDVWGWVLHHAQVDLQPEQLQQLSAGWELLVRALRKLNQDREQLKQKLAAVMLDVAAAPGDVAKAEAGPCNSQQQETPGKPRRSWAFDRHDSASSTSSESAAHQDAVCNATNIFEPTVATQTAAAASRRDEKLDMQQPAPVGNAASSQPAIDMDIDLAGVPISLGSGVVNAATGGAAGPSAGASGSHPATSVAAGGFSASGSTESFRSVKERWVVLDQYEQLADAVERNLLQGRTVVNIFGWAMWQVFNDEQMGRLSVKSWPYWPLARAIAACLLGKQSVLLEKHSC